MAYGFTNQPAKLIVPLNSPKWTFLGRLKKKKVFIYVRNGRCWGLNCIIRGKSTEKRASAHACAGDPAERPVTELQIHKWLWGEPRPGSCGLRVALVRITRCSSEQTIQGPKVSRWEQRGKPRAARENALGKDPSNSVPYVLSSHRPWQSSEGSINAHLWKLHRPCDAHWTLLSFGFLICKMGPVTGTTHHFLGLC